MLNIGVFHFSTSESVNLVPMLFLLSSNPTFSYKPKARVLWYLYLMYVSIKIIQTVLLVIPIKFARTQQINDHSDCTVFNVYCISASDYIHFIAVGI